MSTNNPDTLLADMAALRKAGKPNLLRAGPWAWAQMKRLWDNHKMTPPEYFRYLCNMEFRPVKKQGKTHRQLMKQRARNQRRRPRSWFKQA